MRKIVSFFIRYPIWANALIVLTIGAGIAGFSSLKKSFFPEAKMLNITVQVVYPGASPEEMEEGVTIKVEESLKGIVGIDEVSSTSSENVATINVLINTYADIDEVLADVNNAVDRINSFPEGAEKPVIFKQRPIDRALFLALSGDVELLELKRQAEEIEDGLLASGLISQISISGYSEPEISVEVSEGELLRYGLTFSDLSNAIRLNNRDISAGSIKGTEEELLIRSRYKRVKANEIAEIILRSNTDGTQLRIGDIADVKEQFAETPESTYLNGQRAVTINVQKLPEEDLEQISTFVNEYVSDFNKSHNDTHITVTFDFNNLLNRRISMLTGNGLLGLMLVLFTLSIFLSTRLSFWVAYGIPASFLGMFIIGSLVGITINMISLFGMILVIGILVDDGIVIAENIYSHFERGKSASRAALDGTMEVIPAVTTSVFTTIVAFSILLRIEGFDFIREVAIVVIASLAFSLIEAFLILPAHLANPKVLRKPKPNTAGAFIRGILDKIINFFRITLYGNSLKFIIEYRWFFVWVPLVFIMVISGMQKGGIIKSTFFPSIQFDDFRINIAFNAGEREDKTQAFLEQMEQKVWELNEEIAEEIGDTVITYTVLSVGTAGEISESGSHAGNVNVALDIEGKGISSFEIINRLREKIGDVREANKFSIGGFQRFGSAVNIELSGRNPDELEGASDYLMRELNGISEIRNVRANNAIGKRELEISLKPKADFLGLTHSFITNQIRQGFFGEEVQRLQVGTDEVKIWVRYPENDRLTLGQLEAMKIKTATGEEYPLSELVDYSIKRGVVNIKRFDGARQTQIEADMLNPNDPVPPVLAKIRADVVPQLEANFPGVKVDYGGQQRRSDKATQSMTVNGFAALLVIIVIITLNFRSLYQAILILMMIPIGVYCAFVGHGLEGIPFSILSMYGVLALSGVIINDAVVFLDKYNRNLREGMLAIEAVWDAGINRFRPILLTSITTVVGLFPLIRETDFQAQFIIPMAVSVAYGVLFGTFFILTFFPVLIMIFNDVKRIVKWMSRRLLWLWTDELNGETVTAEEVEPAVMEERRLLLEDNEDDPHTVEEWGRG